VKAVFAAKNPIPLAMLFGSHLRLPLVTLPELQPRLTELMAGYSTADLGIDLAPATGADLWCPRKEINRSSKCERELRRKEPAPQWFREQRRKEAAEKADKRS
jgi:hypothetical protein